MVSHCVVLFPGNNAKLLPNTRYYHGECAIRFDTVIQREFKKAPSLKSRIYNRPISPLYPIVDVQLSLFLSNGFWCKNGNHKESHVIGDRYEGQVRADVPEGLGTYFFANGDRCEGEFQDGILEGRGTYFFAKGDCYVGEFRKNIPEGRGTYFFVNGNRYEGEFRVGKREGQGKLFFLQMAIAMKVDS